MVSNRCMPCSSTRHGIDSAMRAMDRAAIGARGNLRRGVNSLARVAAVAPLVGLFLVCCEVINSFKSCGGEKTAIFGHLGDAFIPGALGLAAGIFAAVAYGCLRNSVEDFDAEMRMMKLQVANALTQA